MSRLKAKPETAQMLPEVRETASDSVTLMAARADMTPHHSPALALQASLQQSWGARHGRDAAQVTKIPFGWTLIGMSVVCAAFWYALLHLVF